MIPALGDETVAGSRPFARWRIRRGTISLAWMRFIPLDGTQTSAATWHLNYDGTDAEGSIAWCRAFATSGSACEWVMQHAGDLRGIARTLGPVTL